MINEFIIEKERKTKLVSEYDALIVGGGIAGVAAAVAAARNGARTCLIEKEYALGGLATLGLVIAYLPICDGMGNLVSSGLAEELLLLAAKDGTAEIPEGWSLGSDQEKRKKNRYFLEYNAASYMLALEDFLIDNNVSFLYDVRAAGVHKNGERIDALIVENKRGREAIGCKAVVDASGDADVCFFAGERTVSLDLNSASGWFYSSGSQGKRLHKLYKPFDPEGLVLPSGTERGYAGDAPEEITEHLLESRRMIKEHVNKLRKKDPQENIYPFMIPSFPGFRMTRRLDAEVAMNADDRKLHPDSVGLIPDWRKAGPVYSIPLSALQGVISKNLFAAGRCISVEGSGWDVARVIPACAVSGEAAGTSAAFFAANGFIDCDSLKKLLIEKGSKIYFNQIGERNDQQIYNQQ